MRRMTRKWDNKYMGVGKMGKIHLDLVSEGVGWKQFI